VCVCVCVCVCDSDINRIPSNMRPVIYCQGVAAGGYEEWMFVWKMYKSQGSVDLFNALCCTNKIWLLNRWNTSIYCIYIYVLYIYVYILK